MITEKWMRCRDWLRPAIAQCGGTHTEDDVLRQLLTGDLQLWVFSKSAVVTEVHTFPRVKCLHIFLGGGDLEELRDVVCPYIEKVALTMGCQRLTINGRDGWERVFGMTKTGTMLHRNIL